jgi:hypothetical protein
MTMLSLQLGGGGRADDELGTSQHGDVGGAEGVFVCKIKKLPNTITQDLSLH